MEELIKEILKNQNKLLEKIELFAENGRKTRDLTEKINNLEKKLEEAEAKELGFGSNIIKNVANCAGASLSLISASIFIYIILIMVNVIEFDSDLFIWSISLFSLLTIAIVLLLVTSMYFASRIRRTDR